MTLLLSGCFLLLTLGQCVLGQPPDRLCREDFRYVDDHNYPDDWHLIVDSYDYENLFGGFSGVWELRDVDGTGGQWGDNFGGTCQLEIGACSFRTPNQNNWFFTDFNSYGKAVEVFIRATFRWSRCTSNSGCTNDFVTVYRYDTNGPVSRNLQIDTSRYTPITGNEMISRLQQGPQSGDTTVELRFNRPSEFNGLYLGFRDTGTCGQIKRFQVYYRIAPPVTDGLLSCPEVPLVTGYINSADCNCAENSSPFGYLKRTCSDDGVCSDLAMCNCDCGYQITSIGKQCIACEAGFYRTLANPMTKCIKCPLNTKEDQPHTCQCECLPRHFRAKDEGPDDGCTSVPDPCTELEAVIIESENATLRWKKPHNTGADEYWYTILRSDQRNIGDFEVMIDRLEDHKKTVVREFTDLTPFTSYVFRVVVQNKVTDRDPDNEHLRRCDVKLTTMEGVPGPPRIVRAFCSEVVWGSPFHPNGKIIGYDLEFYDEKGIIDTYVIKRDDDEHFCNVDEALAREFTHIRVRARTATQNGEWSPEIPLGCDTFSKVSSCACPEPSTCDMLEFPANGRVRHNGRKIGSFATYSCNRGYKLVGVSNRMCQPDGTWSGKKPVCQTTCGTLMNPSNGGVSQSGTSYGSIANYSCDGGYTMDGVANRMCGSDGLWTGEPPKCSRTEAK